jgi:chromosome segregation ATPase
MEFFKKYHAELEKAKKKVIELEKDNDKDLEKVEILEDTYKENVAELNFEEAQKVKGDINKLKAQIEVRNDFISQLDPNSNPKVLKATVGAINSYAEEKIKLVKKGQQLEKKMEEKKQEYLQLARQMMDINNEVVKMRQRLRPVAVKYDWSKVDGLKIDVARETDSTSILVNPFPIYKYRIREDELQSGGNKR